ncbi:hypothetical protein QWY93_09735 [Echinicola jeungdonensis]|uniref:DUF6588 family protein n=1 Tax=Echinicola jeungdonensis TaxID=709343 RepID=A0ABV5J3H7_9BACT|nr:DUF6588 family protein [Echinicola jeungdonensis]MDN3669609.1 hypothetical protein [Echinicola jeungdonensis]
MKKTLYFCCLTFLGAQVQVQAQDEIEQFLQGSQEDLNTYLGNYVKPAAKGFMYSMGSGWAHTAETHKTFGFDIKFGVSASAVPSGYETFKFNNSDYSKTRLANTTGNASADLPTVFGPVETDATLEIYEVVNGDVYIIDEMNVPPGADIPIKYVPAPSVQASLGLPAGFEITGRFIPKLEIDDTEVSQWGVGLKHNLKQFIPVVNKLPFTFSAMAAYNQLEAAYYIERNMGQYGTLDVKTWTFQGMVSKQFAVLTLYGAAGYSTGESDFNILGEYEVNTPEGTETFEDPVSLQYENKGATATLGARIKLGPIFINGDYTFQEFNTINVGLGVSIN